MIAALIWLAIFCGSFLLSLYITDQPKYFKNPPVETRIASVFDLPENASRTTIDKYISNHISPSKRYISLRNEFQETEDSGDVMIQLFMTVMPVVLLVKALFSFFIATHSLWPTIFICIAGIAVCILLGWILNKIYERYWMVAEMYINVSNLGDQLKTLDDEFCVGQTIAKENDMTLYYCAYCDKITKTMRKRIALKSVVTGICAIIYLLFFFRSPYE